MRHWVQPFGILAAEVYQPTVIGARISGRELGIFDRAFPADTDGRIEQSDVDAFLIHHLESGFGIVAAGRTAISVGPLATPLQRFDVHPNATQSAQLSA